MDVIHLTNCRVGTVHSPSESHICAYCGPPETLDASLHRSPTTVARFTRGLDADVFDTGGPGPSFPHRIGTTPSPSWRHGRRATASIRLRSSRFITTQSIVIHAQYTRLRRRPGAGDRVSLVPRKPAFGRRSRQSRFVVYDVSNKVFLSCSGKILISVESRSN
jgi:hypothetical protein